MATCPHCKQRLHGVKIEAVTDMNTVNHWRVITYSCGICDAVLSAAIDPPKLIDDAIARAKLME